MSEYVYAVFKEAIYRHECGGVFDSLQKASDAAAYLLSREKDNHHRFVVHRFLMNRITPHMDTGDWFDFLDEEEPLVTFTK